MKYKEWISEWLVNYIAPSAKLKTHLCYESIVINHIVPCLGEYELEELTPIVLQKFSAELIKCGNEKTGMGLSATTVNLTITIIQNSLEMANTVGYLKEYTANKVKRPRIKEKQIMCFSPTEQKIIEQAVLNHKKPKMFGIVLCLYSGLRIGELLALKWSDINFEKREITIDKSCSDSKNGDGSYCRFVDAPKTASSIRTIPLPKQIFPFLKAIKKKSSSIYVVSDGKKEPSVRSYQRSFELLLKKLDISHRGFHALRHTFATRALECGMDVKTLSEILGHKNPSVTLKRYAHSFMEHKKEMMNKLGKLL